MHDFGRNLLCRAGSGLLTYQVSSTMRPILVPGVPYSDRQHREDSRLLWYDCIALKVMAFRLLGKERRTAGLGTSLPTMIQIFPFHQQHRARYSSWLFFSTHHAFTIANHRSSVAHLHLTSSSLRQTQQEDCRESRDSVPCGTKSDR